MHVLILAGGSGTRFWPLSRSRRPKQLLALEGERSLLQQTVDRLQPLVDPKDIWICTTAALSELVWAQLPEVPAAQVLAEPEGRNTGPAIAWALGHLPAEERGKVVAVLPADHRFGDPLELQATLARAAAVAEGGGQVVALGIQPRWAERGYGYLELGDPLAPGVWNVASFCEKPDAERAEAYWRGGRHLWNGGIFVFRAEVVLDHLDRFEPELAAGLAEIASDRARTGEIYPELKSISIDYAVMERLAAGQIATIPLHGSWSDLGSWEALAEVLPADADGNRCRGDVLAIDARDNLLFSDQGQIAVLGISGLVVVRTGDTVLVLPRERSQDVRRLVEALKSADRKELL